MERLFGIRPFMFFPDTPAKPVSIPAVIPKTHPLIEAVTEPLAANAERRMAAQAILAENFEPGHPAVADLEARLAAPAKPKSRAAWVVVWVLALGVALPIAVFLIITRLTPLGGQSYGIQHFQFAFPGVPLVSLAALAMLLMWALAVLPALERIKLSERVLIGLAAPPALRIALIFANALCAILGKPRARLAQAATALAVLPAYAVAVAALCLTLPMHASAEKRWLAKETLLRIDPNAPALEAYEFKIAAQKRKEINAITGVE